MVAIQTKYLGPTNSRGARVKVSTMRSTGNLTRTYPWDHSLDSHDCHVAAAKRFLADVGWGGRWAFGDTAWGVVAVGMLSGDANVTYIPTKGEES